MVCYLVLANQTLASDELLDELRRLARTGPGSFYLLVPATRSRRHLTYTHGEARAAARTRLQLTLNRLAARNLTATGHVGAENPLEAIRDTLREGSFDEIIVSTLPIGMSRWLKQDLPHRIERTFALPVRHVAAHRVGAPARR